MARLVAHVQVGEMWCFDGVTGLPMHYYLKVKANFTRCKTVVNEKESKWPSCFGPFIAACFVWLFVMASGGTKNIYWLKPSFPWNNLWHNKRLGSDKSFFRCTSIHSSLFVSCQYLHRAVVLITRLVLKTTFIFYK